MQILFSKKINLKWSIIRDKYAIFFILISDSILFITIFNIIYIIYLKQKQEMIKINHIDMGNPK